jgi:hypothetical protein
MQELLWSYVTVKSPYNQPHSPQIFNHCSSPSCIHSYPMTTAGYKIRSILPNQKSNSLGGISRETQSTDILPPPHTVWDQNCHITVQVTCHQLQLQSPGCAPMAFFVGFFVHTVATEQVLLRVLQFSPVKSPDTIPPLSPKGWGVDHEPIIGCSSKRQFYTSLRNTY